MGYTPTEDKIHTRELLSDEEVETLGWWGWIVLGFILLVIWAFSHPGGTYDALGGSYVNALLPTVW